jgi:fumarate reductase subunit C
MTAAPYRAPVSLLWWLRRPSYLLFVVRELSSVFVAWFVAYLLLLGNAVASGEAAYQRFLDLSATPWMIALNLVAFGFVVIHALTWFNLASQAMVVRVRGRRVPPIMVTGANYGAWIVVSLVVAWVVLA